MEDKEARNVYRGQVMEADRDQMTFQKCRTQSLPQEQE
jgi:hypothetical protein